MQRVQGKTRIQIGSKTHADLIIILNLESKIMSNVISLENKKPALEIASSPETAKKWFAMMDTCDLQELGEHKDFFGADEAVKGNSVWIFDENALRKFVAKANAALQQESQPVQNIGGWLVSTSDDKDNQYLYIERDGSPGQITIKAEDEGIVVDLWNADKEPSCVASVAATYVELEAE